MGADDRLGVLDQRAAWRGGDDRLAPREAASRTKRYWSFTL